MKCKMCGATLKKEGDICKNCYNEYKNYEKLANVENENEILTLNRKFSIKFNILKSGEIFILLLVTILAAFCNYSVIISVLITILCIVSFGFWMYFSKKRAAGSKITFYNTKFKCEEKYFSANREEIILYKDIKDMAYFQSTSQKIFGIGDIRFYTKGFLSGKTICDVPNVKENFEIMKQIIVNS